MMWSAPPPQHVRPGPDTDEGVVPREHQPPAAVDREHPLGRPPDVAGDPKPPVLLDEPPVLAEPDLDVLEVLVRLVLAAGHEHDPCVPQRRVRLLIPLVGMAPSAEQPDAPLGVEIRLPRPGVDVSHVEQIPGPRRRLLLGKPPLLMGVQRLPEDLRTEPGEVFQALPGPHRQVRIYLRLGVVPVPPIHRRRPRLLHRRGHPGLACLPVLSPEEPPDRRGMNPQLPGDGDVGEPPALQGDGTLGLWGSSRYRVGPCHVRKWTTLLGVLHVKT